MREPLELLIEVLVNGGRVQADGCEYAMGEDGSLCVIMRDEEGEERGLKVECDLSAAKRMADDIGRDALWLKCCELKLAGANG